VPNEIRIVIAEDHPFFRDGLRQALGNDETLRVIAEASEGLAALESIKSLRPDIAILDISMPEMDGCTVVRQIRKEKIPLEIIFLTICDDEEVFEEALELGVKGYLLKDCTQSEILKCVRAVSSGQYYASPTMTTYLVKRTHQIKEFAKKVPELESLTPHERAILKRIAQDKTSKEIAEEMGISHKTVDAHRTNICTKLKIHGNHVLTRFAAYHRDEI